MMETGDWHTTVMSSKLDWWGGGGPDGRVRQMVNRM